MTSEVCIWTQLALFEGCEEQVEVLVGTEGGEEGGGMKQYVTPEQLQELTPGQQEALREWWKPEPHQLVIDKHGRIAYVYEVERFNNGTIVIWAWMHHSGKHGTFGVGKYFFLPLMGIGQCVELLFDKEYQVSWGEVLEDISYREGDNELVDVLWIAAKELLGRIN